MAILEGKDKVTSKKNPAAIRYLFLWMGVRLEEECSH